MYTCESLGIWKLHIRFDRFGDLVEGPVTIFRLTRKGPVVDRVVTVTAPPVE